MNNIEKKLTIYAELFRNKIVYCNNDNPENSEFYKFFHDNFHNLGLKLLRCSFKGSNDVYEYDGDMLRTSFIGGDGTPTSSACKNLIIDSDIIVSEHDEFLYYTIYDISTYGKKFLIKLKDSETWYLNFLI